MRVRRKHSRITGRWIAPAIGATLILGAGASAEVVVIDQFGDGDRNNDGALDGDLSLDGEVDEGEITMPEDPSQTGIVWTATRGFTGGGIGDPKINVNIIDDSGVLGSGQALALESKGRGSSAAGFFGQRVELGPNVGDQLKLSFDYRFWPDSPNPEGMPNSAQMRFGLFQDTDNQLGQTADVGPFNPDTGLPDENTTVTWGEDDGEWRGSDPGPVGDAGWWLRAPIGEFGDPTTYRIIEEVNQDRFLEGQDQDFVARPQTPDDDPNIPEFPPTIVPGSESDPLVYTIMLTLERTEQSILATMMWENSDGDTFAFGGEESLEDSSDIVGSGGIQSDSWDYFAIRQSSGGTDEDFDAILDNFMIETFSAVSAVTGDADGDGDVDAFDLGIWQTQFGQTGEGLTADFDDDGDVDAFDLGLWQTNFGTGLDGAAVPEPATLGLLALGGLAALRRRRD